MNFVIGYTTTEGDPCLRPITPIPAIQGSGATAAVTGRGDDARRRGRRLRGRAAGSARLLPAGPHRRRRTPPPPTASSSSRAATRTRSPTATSSQVTGAAAEFQGQTQITRRRPASPACGTRHGRADRRDPARRRRPTISSGTRGCSSGSPQTLYVTEHFQLGRFGQVVLSSGDRLRQPTALVAPGAPALAAAGATTTCNRLIIDDATRRRTPTRSSSAAAASRCRRDATRCAAATRSTGLVGVHDLHLGRQRGERQRVPPAPDRRARRRRAAVRGRQPASDRDSCRRRRRSRSPAMNLLNFFNTFGPPRARAASPAA